MKYPIAFLYLFIFTSNIAFGKPPHVDEGEKLVSESTQRNLSSVDAECIPEKSFDCVEFVSQLGPSVLRFSVLGSSQSPVHFFDVKLRGACIDAEKLAQNAQIVHLKNIHLDRHYSAMADVYLDGTNLLDQCQKQRLPSSQ